jgi:hypothetical protein
MSATCRLIFLLGVTALIVSAAPVHADHLIAAPRGGVANDRAFGSGPAAFQSREGALPPAVVRVDPRLVLALILAVPAGTKAETDSGNTNVKAPDKGSGGSNGGDQNGHEAGGSSASLSPEPATLVTALIGAGVAGYAALRRRRAHATQPKRPLPVSPSSGV